MIPKEPEAGSRIQRRRFLELYGLSFFSGIAIAITGCNSSPTAKGGSGGTPDHVATVANNHGHSGKVTGGQLDAGGTVTLDIQGTATHSHSVTLTATQLSQIKSNTLVTVASAVGGTDNHTHDVTFNAPGTVPAPPSSSSPSGW